MKRLVAVLLSLSLGGCGLLQTRGPDPRRPAGQRPDCTESLAAPIRDAVGAGLGFGTFLTGLLFVKVDDNNEVGVPLMIGGGVLVAGFYASALIGGYRVKKCRKAVAEFERRSAPDQ